MGGSVAVTEVGDSSKCNLCGRVAELRPYGPRGENICFTCGMNAKTTTERQMKRVLFNEVEM